MTSQLDPTRGRTASFLFTRCQVRLDGADLLVTVSAPGVSAQGARCISDAAGIAWDPPAPISGEVTVACEGGGHSRRDRNDYPRAVAYASPVSFRFTGAFSYGRVPYGGLWALHVEGALLQMSGPVSAFDPSSYDAVVVSTSSQEAERLPGSGSMMATRLAASPDGPPDAPPGAPPDAGLDCAPGSGPHMPFP